VDAIKATGLQLLSHQRTLMALTQLFVLLLLLVVGNLLTHAAAAVLDHPLVSPPAHSGTGPSVAPDRPQTRCFDLL
jgi:hypothetical protein